MVNFLDIATGGLTLPYSYLYNLYSSTSFNNTATTTTSPTGAVTEYSLINYTPQTETFGTQLGSAAKWILIGGAALLAFKYFKK